MKNFKLKKLLTLIAVTFVTAAVMLPIKASAAWKQSDSGNWSYTEGDTSVSGWKSIDGKWYFFDSNAIMKTGWILDGSTWYYIAPSGDMKTGWVNDAGKWYYIASSGAMQTGWLSNNGSWYYLSTSGDMKTGLVDLNNKTYYLSESGAMKTGNVTVNGINYSFAASGEKLNSTNANSTTSSSATTNSTTNSSSSGSSSSSSDSTTTSSHPYYESLYGTWIIGNNIPSNIPIDSTYSPYISLIPGGTIKIESNKLSLSVSFLNKTISNPTIKEGTMTSSEFYSKYNDTLKNVGISGDTVKYVHISNSSYYVDIFIADDDTVYALVKGALFELEKQ